MNGNSLTALCTSTAAHSEKPHAYKASSHHGREASDKPGAAIICPAASLAKTSHMPIRHALMGRNELNTTATVQRQEIVSDSQHRAERQVSSYFLTEAEILAHLHKAGHLNKVPAILAYGIYKQWMMRRRTSLIRPDDMLDETGEMVFYTTALLLVETMVFAMRVDGRIDSDQYQSLVDFCQAVFNDRMNVVRGEIDNMLTVNLDPESIATKVRFAEESLDIYLLSAVMLDAQHPLGQAYLELLSACLGIGPTARRELDRRALRMITDEVDPADRGLMRSAMVSY